MKTVLEECGIEKKSALHSFRHTAAMKMLDAGIPINEVANQLGDTVETVVRNYVRSTMPSRSSIDRAFSKKDRKKTGEAPNWRTTKLDQRFGRINRFEQKAA